MKIPLKYYKWVRNVFIVTMISAPFAGYYYVQSKMKNMEKGITDDIKRIQAKGKTFHDIPRKE